MPQKKGAIPWNKGTKGVCKPNSGSFKKGFRHTEEWKEKLREASLGLKNPFFGKKHSEETKRKMRGRKISDKHKEAIRKAHLGRKFSKETKKKMSLSHKGINIWSKGRKVSQEVRKVLSEKYKGNKCHFWKGGITTINLIIRNSLEYRLWREAVFKRDNWTCVWCKQRGVKLNADHIKRFSDYPELRFKIDNGRTLCVDCHRKTDTWGNKKHLI